MRTHLKRKGVAAGDAETAIDRLKELSLVADSETARAWIRDRMNLAPRGRGLLRRELLSKGVGSEVVDEALEDLVPEADESAAAVEFLRKGAYKWRGLAEGVARKRMWSALARRGFPSSVCRDALTQFAEQQDFDAADTA